MNNNNNSKNTKAFISKNLIGDEAHKDFLAIQAEFGAAQHGGAYPFNLTTSHVNRLISDVNILTSLEKKQMIFSGTIFTN